jgi:hypothetical protein
LLGNIGLKGENRADEDKKVKRREGPKPKPCNVKRSRRCKG